jgi:hypothetical protein
MITGSLIGEIFNLECVQNHGYADNSSVILQPPIPQSRLLFTRSTSTRNVGCLCYQYSARVDSLYFADSRGLNLINQ